MRREIWAAAFVGLFSVSAAADEQITPLAISGDWMAAAHRESITAAPDVCVAANMQSGFTFRASERDGIEIRVTDKSWSLPANVQGGITVTVGDVRQNLGSVRIRTYSERN